MKHEYLDNDDFQNYTEHIQDACSDRLIPEGAQLEAIYQYFDFQTYVGTVLFMRLVVTDSDTGHKRQAPYWLVATPSWDSLVFENAGALYRYLSTIKDRLRYDMYGCIERNKWVLRTTASVDVGSFVSDSAQVSKRFGDE